MKTTRQRLDWPPILTDAALWVSKLGITPTLRQVFYHLVTEGLIPNTVSAYKRLSDRTALGRREGWFPDLEDGTRSIAVPATFEDIADLSREAARWFRLDRWAVQDTLVVVGVEKRGMQAQFENWFGDFGFPIVALGGYSSQTQKDEVARLVARDGRDSVLLYAGDFDATGLDIFRDFVDGTGCWSYAERVALSDAQVIDYSLPVNPGKDSDSRHAKFAAQFGDVQVEVDALDPRDLRGLFDAALEDYVDLSAHAEVVAREAGLRAQFERITGIGGGARQTTVDGITTTITFEDDAR